MKLCGNIFIVNHLPSAALVIPVSWSSYSTLPVLRITQYALDMLSF